MRQKEDPFHKCLRSSFPPIFSQDFFSSTWCSVLSRGQPVHEPPTLKLANRAAAKWAMEIRVTWGHMVTPWRTHLFITSLLAWLVSGRVSIRRAWMIPSGVAPNCLWNCSAHSLLSQFIHKWKVVQPNQINFQIHPQDHWKKKKVTIENPESPERDMEEN